MATLSPMPHQAALVALTGPFCIACGSGGLADFLLNIALFVPFGVGLACAGLTTSRVVVLGLGLSAGVELLQFGVIPGRDATIGDVLANTVGSGLGWGLMHHWRSLLQPARQLAAGLAAGWSVVALGGTAGTLWLLEPAPPAETWYGQWTTGGSSPEWFEGEVLSVTLNGREVPHWRIEDWASRREEILERRQVDLQTRLVTGPVTTAPLRILALATDDGRFADLTQVGADLRWDLRLRASNLKLRSPALLYQGVLPDSAGDTIVVRVAYRNRIGTAQVERVGSDTSMRMSLGWTDGWRLLLATSKAGRPVETVLATLWLLGLFAPMAWWTWMATRPRGPE